MNESLSKWLRVQTNFSCSVVHSRVMCPWKCVLQGSRYLIIFSDSSSYCCFKTDKHGIHLVLVTHGCLFLTQVRPCSLRMCHQLSSARVNEGGFTEKKVQISSNIFCRICIDKGIPFDCPSLFHLCLSAKSFGIASFWWYTCTTYKMHSLSLCLWTGIFACLFSVILQLAYGLTFVWKAFWLMNVQITSVRSMLDIVIKELRLTFWHP